MTNAGVDSFTTNANDAFANGSLAAEKNLKDGAAALSESSQGSAAATQDLTKAYQELAAKNVKNLTAAIHALSSVKSPLEFVEVQQRLLRDGVEAAVGDGRHIAQLTAAMFTAAFEPLKKQFEAATKTAQN